MKRYAAIRIFISLAFMIAWLLAVYFDPYGLLKNIIVLGIIWANYPFSRIKPKRSICSRITIALAMILMIGLGIWLTLPLKDHGMDIITISYFMLLIVGITLQSWALVVKTSEQKLNEAFGGCIGAALFKQKEQLAEQVAAPDS